MRKPPDGRWKVREEVNKMEVIIRGKPEEIAALVLAVQGRRGKDIMIDPETFFRSICDKDQEAQ